MTIEITMPGSVVLVTGAGAGIGREIATWFARADAIVAVNDIDPVRAADTAARICADGGHAVAFAADVRSDDALDDMFARILTDLGRLDVSVNNVGMMAGRKARAFLDTPLDDAWAVIEQNLHATYRCCRAEATVFARQGQGGVIINVASGEATRPALGLASYGAAKAAIVHLTTTLAVELGPLGIRVNAVAPGTTYTADVAAVIGQEQFDAISRSTPLQRVCEPDELGRLCVVLASDLARCITGQLILADAGAHLGRLPLRLPERED
ncbi:MAG: 3-oxoacyl-ACP reductase [Ilumatobacteraceae bacterium]|nr:3-oxoacyl-ACP reductase [Ilumatobacteraceae bacterium]MCU1391166.1 3-oxoacyl-ACP reductase [Ilumatobacteraceae bacterium]